MNIENPKTLQVLSELSTLIKNGDLTKEEVLSNLEIEESKTEIKENKLTKKFNAQQVFYYLGGFIVFLGIVFFVYQFWHDMNQVAKMFVTLGSAVSAYALGYHFFVQKKSKDLGQAFFIISAALFPLGIGVTLNTIGIPNTTNGGITINAALLFLIFFVTYYSTAADIFLPFSIISATTLFFSSTNMIPVETINMGKYYQYRFIAVGLSYMFLSYYLIQQKRRQITELLYLIGASMVLGTALSLQESYSPLSYVRTLDFWEIIYPFLLVGMFRLSLQLQSKGILLSATIFTFFEIIKITGQYFSDSVGWPISLIIAGLLIMATGYMSFEFNKKFKTNRVV